MNGVMMTHVSIDQPRPHRRRRIATSAAVTLAAAGALTFGPVVAAHADTTCPSGAVCIYAAGDWTDGTPEYVFWSYGVHNLSGVYGSRDVVNNQTGGASANLCLGYNGTNCHDPQQAYDGWLPPSSVSDQVDFGPINSVVLNRP